MRFSASPNSPETVTGRCHPAERNLTRMTSTDRPQPSHLVTLPDGRRLGIDETGPADGPALVFLHSSPGSRRFDPSPAETAAAGVRLITLDRPGYGASSPLADYVIPSVPAIANDLAAGLAELGVNEFALSGWSAGGRFAAALAARYPEQVRSLAVIATPAPDDQVPWVPEHYREMARQMRAEPESARGIIESQLGEAVGNGEAAFDEVATGPADEAAVAADPDLARRVRDMLIEGLATSASGVAADIVSDQVAPWGFDPSAIGATTTCFYGDGDTICGREHGRWWADAIPDADLRVVAGAGHLVVARVWAVVLGTAKQ